MLRIIHRIQDGEVTERLVSLDGSGREFIRSGSRARLLPARPAHRGRREAASRRARCSATSRRSMRPRPRCTTSTEIKRTRFNRRNTRVIAVTPRDEFRYGYRLWIDELTAMPLKTQLCDPAGPGHRAGGVRGSDACKARIANADFKPEVATEGFQWVRNERGTETSARPASPVVLSALRLPPGFRIDQPLGPAHAGLDLARSRTWCSRTGSPPCRCSSRPQYAPDPFPRAGCPARRALGSSSAFSTVVDGSKVIVVGEVPPATVQFIANSLNERSAGPALIPRSDPL